MFEIERFEQDATFEYGLRGATEQKLVPTRLVVRVRVPASTPRPRRLTVSAFALPIGLLSSIELRTMDALDAPDATFPVPFRVHVTKATGSRESARTTTPSSVSLTHGPLCVDQDAVDEDLRAVAQKTGHMMAFRAVAASSVANIELEFDEGAAVPDEFYIVYRGANMLPLATDTAAAFRRGSGVAFGFPPLWPKQRRALINARLSGLPRTAV